MTHPPMQELQSELSFQLSLIRLMYMQNMYESAAVISKDGMTDLEEALTRMADAIQ